MTAKAAWKRPTRSRVCAIRDRLRGYYGRPRNEPHRAPLDELVLTVLSQNTNDRNRDQAFLALRARFPTWEQVRNAPTAQIVEAIRPAGLANQKGPRIQEVLRQITQERGELDLDFLRTYPDQEALGWLMRFKGVGPKTASIVLQFALGKAAFPVDTHVYRVSGRIGLRPEEISVLRRKPHAVAEARHGRVVGGTGHKQARPESRQHQERRK